jgi:hypothetical protein
MTTNVVHSSEAVKAMPHSGCYILGAYTELRAMTTVNRASVCVLVIGVAAVGMLGAIAPTSGAATGVTGTTVTPSAVSTGEATALSFSMTVNGVDASDGTTDGSVTLSFPDSVTLTGARVTKAAVGPNASDGSGVVDVEAGTVTVTWNDAGRVSGENLSVAVDIDGVVVTRTGDAMVTVAVDADASGSAEVTTTAGTVTAVSSGSDRSVMETPGTLYFGEHDVDLTGITEVNAAGSAQQFYGVSGDAEGGIAETTDTQRVNVTTANGFETGGYALNPSTETVQVSIVRPQVTDIEISPGQTLSAVDVANKSVPRGTGYLTVSADRNFAEARNATVTVVDEEGIDVTEQLTDSPTITGKTGSVTLDVSSLDVGTYNVTVEGADDLDSASQTVTVRVRDSEKVISLSKTRVTRGDSTIVSIAGEPGAVRYVRVAATDLEEGVTVNTPTARSVFDDTEAVQSIGADSDLGVVYAVVALNDDGLADIRIQTARVATKSIDVELAEQLTETSEDEAELTVTERRLTISKPQPTVVGEPLTMSGTAVESDRVKLYAAADESYIPLYTDEGELAEPEVAGDGTWDSEIETNRVVDQPGIYRIVAVADPGSTQLGSTEPIDDEILRTFEVRSTTSLRMQSGTLTANVSQNEVAATGDDEVRITGTAVGQGDSVRVYLISPRGHFLGTDATAGQSETIDVNDGEFEEEYDAFDTRGTYTFLIVSQGRDGEYASNYGFGDATRESDLTPQQAVEIVNDEYTGAGVDDQMVELTVRAETPSLTINDFTADGQVVQGEAMVSGTSNREDGTPVFIEVVGERQEIIASTEGEVNGKTGEWSARVNLSDAETGTYTLRVSDDESSSRLEFEIVDSIGTATQTQSVAGEQTEATAVDSPGTLTQEPVENTTTELTNVSTTNTSAIGFHVTAVLVAFFIVLLSTARRD